MIVGFHATKLVVADLGAAEAFYRAIGLRLVARNEGGEGDVHQRQAWFSVSGDSRDHMLILSQFPEAPAPPLPAWPGECWLAFNVADVEALLAGAVAAGGRVLRAGEDRPEHGVRAAVICDPEGHVIEVVGPMLGASAPLADPLAVGAAARKRD
ncbi:MAG: VOC family protein [Sphingomonadales bacterium]|nr:VOC family protein [Sphingomonadales bacterium]